jgi:dTDP-4-amino-4,6-dideoxygalactose transaminase
LGIQTQVHYPVPPHHQAAYPELAHLRLPVTEQLHDEVLSLPMSPVLSDAQVAQVVAACRAFAEAAA